ncbi:MAG: tRNA 2-thiocytidine biosynthesis TtcA family protein [Candidatus Algichlamydia australiensis]|nr:tRNA 2-thiocytidine biosynthesis TtcA family protein [Chlamydiales bacterium]
MFVPTAKPPWTALGRKLESICRKALYEFALLEEEGPLALALSGGKDSLTLLFLLKAILGRGFPKKKIYAIHVSGAFSCGASIQRNYLESICKELDVEFRQIEVEGSREGLECYSCSRRRRNAIFATAKEVGAKTIAFGHHKDDLAETLLLNVLHKGEFAGMLPKICMKKVGVTIVRPLIYADEAEIRKFAESYGFARITCQCPVGANSKRRKVKNLITEMEEIFPEAGNNLARASLLYGSQKAASP